MNDLHRTAYSKAVPTQMAGFTLVELMIAVAIVAILAAIAIPSYSEHIRKSYRSDAQTELLEFMQMQQRYHTINGTYAPDMNTLLPNDGINNRWRDTDSGQYQIRARNTGNCALVNDCIILQMNPKSNEMMQDDSRFRLWSTGQKFHRPQGGGWTTGWEIN